MKSHIITACILTTLSTLALHAENLVKNGDFDTGDGDHFWQTAHWYNRGTDLNQGISARSQEGNVIAGSHSAFVNDRYLVDEAKFGTLAHTQNTGYVIEEGDSFSLSYLWRPANQYWQRSADTIRFVFYATENDMPGGEVVWSSELTSDFFTQQITAIMSVVQTSDVVNSDAVGHVLFVMFYGVDTLNGGKDETPHYARVDNIEVEVIKKGGSN